MGTVVEAVIPCKTCKFTIGITRSLLARKRWMTSLPSAKNVMRPLPPLSVPDAINRKPFGMQQLYKAHLTSACPLIVNNGRLINRHDPYSQALKQLTSKGKNKTEADLDEIAKLEWHGSLYLLDGHPCLPTAMIEATFIAASYKIKKGPKAKAGMYAPHDVLLQYDGPQTIEGLWNDTTYHFFRNCKAPGQRGSVMRMRPIFPEWAADIELVFSDEQLSKEDVHNILVIAGRDIGFGNWRPKYGRFDVS